MKSLVLVLVTLFSFNAFADEPMTEAEKKEYIAKVAKDFRQYYWKNGFNDVESRIQKFEEADVLNYIKRENNNRYHEPLDDYQVGMLSNCLQNEVCEVYKIRITNSFHSGWAEYTHFAFLNVVEHDYDWISHLVYGE